MPSSASSFAQFLSRDLSSGLHSRRLLLASPHDNNPQSVAAISPISNQNPPGPYAAANGFDANVVMVLSVLICALICSIGINSIVRCALRCSILAATGANNNESLSTRAANTNTGIKRKALKTFTTVNYSADLKLPGLAAECVICLSEFATGERVRLLPKCNHGFHLRCIDKWLTSHSSCPTCRHNIMETCQKIVGCDQATPSQSLAPPQQGAATSISIMIPLQHEDVIHVYRGNSSS